MTNNENGADERTPLLSKSVQCINSVDSTPQEDPIAGRDGQVTETALAQEDEWSTLKLSITLGSAYVGVFLAAMDSTIIATLSAPISNSFNSFTLLSWLASAYLIANAGFQPISGKLSDIFGRRPCLLAANVFFAAGNLICGLANDEWVIILGRVISGIGGILDSRTTITNQAVL